MGGPHSRHLQGGKFSPGAKHLQGGKFSSSAKHLGGTKLSHIKRMSASGAEVRQKMQASVSRIQQGMQRSIIAPSVSRSSSGTRSTLAHASQYAAARQQQLEDIIAHKTSLLIDYVQGNSSGLSSAGLTDVTKRITTTIGSIGLVNTVVRTVGPSTGERTVI